MVKLLPCSDHRQPPMYTEKPPQGEKKSGGVWKRFSCSLTRHAWMGSWEYRNNSRWPLLPTKGLWARASRMLPARRDLDPVFVQPPVFDGERIALSGPDDEDIFFALPGLSWPLNDPPARGSEIGGVDRGVFLVSRPWLPSASAASL